jgi:hypothetical protein
VLPVLPTDIPLGTTVESLVTEVFPALHARLVAEGVPDDAFSVALRIEGRGAWTVRIRGREMRVDAGEESRPTLWMYTTADTAEHFLRDALGPMRLFPKAGPMDGRPGALLAMSDPRVIKRVAMVSGRIELAVLDGEGTRLAVVFGFGDAARRPIDPHRPDAIAEGSLETLERALSGGIAPDEAISSGAVTVRGSRLLVLQLAFAVAPFCLRDQGGQRGERGQREA